MSRQEYFFDRGYIGEEGTEFYVAGKARNGDVTQIEPGIVAVGQDCLLYKPELDLYGVFDGSGGATDVGDPRVAAVTAARSVVEFFEQNNMHSKDTMLAAMSHARRAVIADEIAGLSTALFMRLGLTSGELDPIVVTAGDSMAGMIPEAQYNSLYMDWLTPDQIDLGGNPTNILGRVPEDISIKDEDVAVSFEVKRNKDRTIMLASDGVTGNYRIDDGVDEVDIEHAFDPIRSLAKSAHLLINPPLLRQNRRKVDDKSLILVTIPRIMV